MKIRNKIFIFLLTIIFLLSFSLISCTNNSISKISASSEINNISLTQTTTAQLSDSSKAVATIKNGITVLGKTNSTTTASQTATTSKESSSKLLVHFIDVGQGDSILIQTPDGINMLIDGGPKSSSEKLVSYLKNLNITKINIIVSTHPHEDHIGGLADVINNFTVDNVIDSGNPHTTNTYKNYLNAIKTKNINYIIPDLGQEFKLGSSTKIKILGPVTKTTDLNNSSIVIKLTFGSISFLFTGDAQNQEESQILSKGYDLSSQVLKVGHHGSSSSSSIKFLKSVSPSIAVISCGKNNSYGHPHEITLKNLANLGITIYRTDTTGDIEISSDGNSLDILKGSPYNYTSQNQTTTTQAKQTTTTSAATTTTKTQAGVFVGSKNSNVFHRLDCTYAKRIKESNRVYFSSYEDAIAKGYRPCKVCNPTP